MRILMLFVLFLGLAGCAPAGIRLGVTVTPAQVRTYAEVCAKPTPGLSAMGYVAAGFEVVDQQCGVFFDNLILFNKDARFASSSIATLNTQAALILEAVDRSANTIAIVAAGTEIARKLIDGSALEYGFAPYALETRRLVMMAMERFREAPKFRVALASLEFAESGGAYCAAQNIVRNYAKICSLSGIEALAREAIANSSIRESGDKDRDKADASEISEPRIATLAPADIGAFYRTLDLPNFEAGND